MIINKRNTMLLTIIAVATLFVAVVGASFAFFSLKVDGGSSTTTAKVTTGKVGLITFSGDSQTMTLTVSAQDMAKGTGDVSYYAILSNGKNDGATTGGVWTKDTATIPLTTISIDGGEATDTYSCDYTVSIAKEGTMLTPAEGGATPLKEGDMFFKLEGQGLTGTDNIDVTKLQTSYKGKFTLNGQGGTTNSTQIKASLRLVNSFETEQSYLANKNLKLTINISASNCSISS